jgi:hypothetical protein
VTAANPADVELVAAKLAAAGNERMAKQMAEVSGEWGVPYRAEEFTEMAADAVAALAGAGRLLPPDTDTRPEFGVRMTWDDGSVTEDACERSLADARVRFHAERRSVKPDWRVIKAEMIERMWRVGPWVSVPTEV